MHENTIQVKGSRSLPVGVSEYLGTEICTSRQKRFSLVTFVDSPGLVDGDMKYPFDVDQAIMWLGRSPQYGAVCVCGVGCVIL